MAGKGLKIFDSGIPTKTTVSCDGEILWVAVETPAEGRRILTNTIADLVLDGAGACWGGKADLVLTDCTDGFRPHRAIVGGQTLLPIFDGKTLRFPRFLLLPGMDNLRRRGRLDGVVRGERVAVATRVIIAHAPHGAALRTQSGWRPVVHTMPFLCGHHDTGLLWASLPKMVNDPDWTVFEGSRPVAEYRESGIRLDRKLIGLGEALTIEQRRFNRTSGTTRISDLVLNTGIVSEGGHRGDRLAIRTATPIHWTEQHRAIGIHADGARELVPLLGGNDANELRFVADQDVGMVCLSHRGTWLNAPYVAADIEGSMLSFFESIDGWKEKIAVAVNARLPLLTPRTRTRVT